MTLLSILRDMDIPPHQNQVGSLKQNPRGLWVMAEGSGVTEGQKGIQRECQEEASEGSRMEK